jgi:hypothetical protein
MGAAREGIPVPSKAAALRRARQQGLLADGHRRRRPAVQGSRVDEDRLAIEAGKRTVANAAARPNVSLLAPGPDGDYSLIIDGTATVEDSVC